jgi:hypothetical protein
MSTTPLMTSVLAFIHARCQPTENEFQTRPRLPVVSYDEILFSVPKNQGLRTVVQHFEWEPCRHSRYLDTDASVGGKLVSDALDLGCPQVVIGIVVHIVVDKARVYARL